MEVIVSLGICVLFGPLCLKQRSSVIAPLKVALSSSRCVCLDQWSCRFSLEAGGLVSLPDWNPNWFVHLFLCSVAPLRAPVSVCHLNNKCWWSPDLLRGAGLWCILISLHSALYQTPSFIWIKEVEFKNSQCFTWIQIASIYCTEWWNGRRLCPSPLQRSTTSHKSKKGFTPGPLGPLVFNMPNEGHPSVFQQLTDSESVVRAAKEGYTSI